jgi:exosortase
MRTRIAGFAAIVVLVAALQADVLADLYALSRNDPSASHVVLIPLVSLALVFQRRKEIFTHVSTAWPAGLVVGLAGIVLALLASSSSGLRSGQDGLTIRVLAVVTMWAGGFLLSFGTRAFRSARFAMGFLLLTAPLPTFVLDGMTQLLKRGSTEVVAWLFALTPMPFHREGFVFNLPTVSIEVADACSGIRSTLAMMLTALLAGHMWLESGWKKAVLVFATLPIAILKNGVRIVSLSLLATYVDPSFLVGRLHNDGGVVFFGLALVMLLPVLTILRRLDSPEPGTRRESVVFAPGHSSHH